jgi:hypothetical protein
MSIASPTHPAKNVTEACGECHGLGKAGDNLPVPKTDPYWLRFQAMTLTWSRCYSESGGGVSCVNCHNPHRDAETSPAYYEAKCLECHDSTPAKPSATAHSLDTACPVSPTKGCLECHMPRTYMPVYRSSVSDHYIRVPDKKQARRAN